MVILLERFTEIYMERLCEREFLLLYGERERERDGSLGYLS